MKAHVSERNMRCVNCLAHLNAERPGAVFDTLVGIVALHDDCRLCWFTANPPTTWIIRERVKS